jgi:hypothetical protein
MHFYLLWLRNSKNYEWVLTHWMVQQIVQVGQLDLECIGF